MELPEVSNDVPVMQLSGERIQKMLERNHDRLKDDKRLARPHFAAVDVMNV